MSKEKSMYLVPYIEVEYGWGSRSEGYSVYSDLNECINNTKKNSERGNYESGGGYYGPERPLKYYEAPFDKKIVDKGWADELPKFHARSTSID